MRYSKIRSMDIANGEGIGVALFVQGCPFHCEGCFNPETWDFNGGKEWNDDIAAKFIKLAGQPFINRISILGGEPLCKENATEVYILLHKLKEKYPNKKIWIYTGYRYEEIDPRIYKNIDIIVDGQFEEDKKDIRLKFRGSSNQRIIDVKETIKQNKITTIQN